MPSSSRPPGPLARTVVQLKATGSTGRLSSNPFPLNRVFYTTAQDVRFADRRQGVKMNRVIVWLACLCLLACGGGASSDTSTPNPAPPLPPVITTQPTKVIAVSGTTASFSVVASGAGAFSYQWRRSGTDIAGATQASYSLVVGHADDSAAFSVKVSSPTGSVSSSEALLRVTPAAASTPNHVRVLYVIPMDRAYRQEWSNNIQNACMDLQVWLMGQLGGKTFTLYAAAPEVIYLPHTSDYYLSDTWTKVLSEVQAFLPVSNTTPDTTWLLYVDVLHGCNLPGRLGAGMQGLTMLPRGDMEGLAGAPCLVDDCGTTYCFPTPRYTGGLGHELGHAFGLPHPPGCDAGLGTCDSQALMWLGYTTYPNTYLRADEKALLLASRFFH